VGFKNFEQFGDIRDFSWILLQFGDILCFRCGLVFSGGPVWFGEMS
jgi:hypothetical protein